MLPLTKKLQLVGIGLACSLFFAPVLNVIFEHWRKAGDFAGGIDLYFYKLFFASTQSPDPRLIIIDSDDREERRSRAEYARMIDALRQAGASIVAFDIRFIGEKDREGDSALVRSVAQFPRSVLSISFAGDYDPSDWAIAEMGRFALPQAACDTLVPMILAERGVDLPFDSLLAVTKNMGHINSVRGQDHHFPAVIRYGDSCYASLPLKIAQLYFAADTGAISSDGVPSNSSAQGGMAYDGVFSLAKIPLDQDGQMLVNFIDAAVWENNRQNFFTWEGVFDVIRGGNEERFQGAVVLIINSAAETSIDGPRGPYPRWGMLASLISQTLSGRHIDTSVLFLPAMHSSIISVAGMLLFLFVAPRLDKKWRKIRIIFVTGSGFFLLMILFVLRTSHVWIGVTVPLLVYNMSMLVVRQRYYQVTKIPLYENFGIAVLERTEKGYPIKIFEAPGGSEEGELHFDPGFLDERAFREALERIWALQASDRDVRMAGSKLFDALFPQQAFHLLKNSLQQVERQRKNLRLILHLDAPELMRLPWELMHSARLPPGRLAMNRHISLVRFLPLAQPFERKPYHIPLDVLIVVSGPTGALMLDVAGEKAKIKKALHLMKWGGDLRLHFCEHATLDRLREALEQHKPDVLHFIGHGQYDENSKSAALAFEAEDGSAEDVSAETLGEILHDSPVRLVVLNSCESAASSPHDAFAGVAQRLVNVGVPAVIAMQFKILDTTAQLFSAAFYSSLIDNYSIEAAATAARMKIMAKARNDLLGWATPVLYMRAKDGEIFKMEK